MGRESSPYTSVFSIDVAASPQNAVAALDSQSAMVMLMQQMLVEQQKQNQLLEQLLASQNSAAKQRAAELAQWRSANPYLARACRQAAEVLAKVQVSYLERIADEVADNEENLVDGEFMLSEFVDRFGPRLAHLNGVLQVLVQLSGTAAAAEDAEQR